MMKTRMATAAPWALMVLFGAVAAGGLCVSYRAQCVIENFQNDLEALRAENAQLRELLGKANLSITVQVAATNETIAERCKNFMNIKRLGNGEQWLGQVGVDRFGHVIFSHPAYSIRAGAMILRNYEKRHGINTIEGIVKRFSENNHEAYIAHLCRELKLRKDQKFSITARLPELIRAMVKFETGKDLAGGHAELVAAVRG